MINDAKVSTPLEKVPVNSAEDEGSSRRTFVKIAVGGMCLGYAGAIGYPIFRYLNSPVEKAVELASVTEVTLAGADNIEKGSVMLFKFGADPAMLIHHQSGEWVAFDAVCTHLGCTVQYHPDVNKIICNCHGGTYDPESGENLSGPPPRPLTKFKVKVGKGQVVVSRV